MNAHKILRQMMKVQNPQLFVMDQETFDKIQKFVHSNTTYAKIDEKSTIFGADILIDDSVDGWTQVQ